MSAEMTAGVTALLVACAGVGVAALLARRADAAAREVDRLDAVIAARTARAATPGRP